MVKYTRHRKQSKQSKPHRKHRKSLRKTRRRISRRSFPKMGGGVYSPVGPNGGDYGPVPESYPTLSTGALPDPAHFSD